MEEKPPSTTIRVSKELHEFLTKQAIRKDESYDEIIKRLLEKLYGVKITPEAKKINN